MHLFTLKAVKDDGFPDKLCAPCRSTINDSYVLQQKCKNNQTLLCGVLNITVNEPSVESQKPKVCLTIGTQTEVEEKVKGENAITQTDWDTSSVLTQTSNDSRTIQTQTQQSLKSIGLQTAVQTPLHRSLVTTTTQTSHPIRSIGSQTITTETKCSTAPVECQTEEWIISDVYTDPHIEIISTTSEVPEEEEEDEEGPNDVQVDMEFMEFIEDAQIKPEYIIEAEEEDQEDIDDEDVLEEVEYLIDDDDDVEVKAMDSQAVSPSTCKLCQTWFGTFEEMEEHLEMGCLKITIPKKRKKR